ncbi:hypothetical protein [Streptomyces sp. NBC_00005]|uniref:hypothetical protein n=1 Tax=Streptomyces sp. NBC_00005 TaxID=2903609 RepID=UPI003247C488
MTASTPPVLLDERLASGIASLALRYRGRGVDLTDAFPKPLTDEVVQAADIVITMGCGDACPIVPGRGYLDWPVTDPEGAPIAVVRGIRDEIDAHITELLDSLPSS